VEVSAVAGVEWEVKVRFATIHDFDNIMKIIDNDFIKEGYGFVNKEQVRTELGKGRVIVAEIEGEILGVRIGLNKVWNLVVSRGERGTGIGKKLIEFHPATTIRVKAIPVGHLSKAQKIEFKDPRGFYEKLGFSHWSMAKAKNFWSGEKDGKRIFYKQGEKEHIFIYKRKDSLLNFD
jgi:GNAT superfamily N-acetyltransferase